MKKIIIETDEGVAEVIDRMLNEPDNDITLVVSNGSVLGKTTRNFYLLKREAEDAGRTLTIESVDENILALARKNGIESHHPLWAGSVSGGFSDILPEADDRDPQQAAEESHSRAKPRKSTKAPVKKQVREATPVKIVVQSGDEEEVGAAEYSDESVSVFTSEEEEKEIAFEEKKDEGEKKGFFTGKRFFEETGVPEARDEESEPHRGITKKIIGYGVFAVLIVAGVFFSVPQFLGSVKVTIDFKQTPWEYTHVFTADKSVTKIDPVNDIIPAQVFTANKNITQLFPASGNANVSQKAKGTIVIYNAYSSAAQTLVATTRFVTPDGKIFRLINGVTVPGAQVTNGQIVPSSINAPVVADQAGDAYNVGPIAKLAIPGFQGTAKYDGFYGSLTSSTTGGFVGNKAVPTASDITAAKAKVTSILQSAFQSGALANYPENFRILDGATSTATVKLVVSTSTDQNGNFSVFGEAVFQAIGFDETALKAFLLAQAGNGATSSMFSALNMNYSGTQADFTKGIASFTLDASGTTEPAFSTDDFRNAILGKSVTDARSMIVALPQLADGTISAWPSWLANIPSDSKKVQMVVH